MSELESNVMDQEESTETEHGESVKQARSLESIVNEAITEKDAEPEEKPRPAHKKPANQRIQEVIAERNEAQGKAAEAEKRAQTLEASMTEKLERMESKLAEIETRAASGQISATKAAAMKAEVADDLEDIEVPEELADFKDVLTKMAERTAARATADLRKELDTLKAIENERQAEAQKKAHAEFTSTIQNNLKEVSGEFPDLFTGQVDSDGLPIMKAEIDDRADKIIREFNIPLDEKGKEFYNPILASKTGLHMLLTYLALPAKEAKAKSAEVHKTREAVERAKASRIESPGKQTPGPKRKQTLDEIVNEAISEHGG